MEAKRVEKTDCIETRLDALLEYGHVELVKITPELAKTWLAAPSQNRKLSKTTVRRYEQQILLWRWTPSNDLICIDRNGEFVNGQHRCQAIINTGVAVWAWVWFDCPPEIITIIDNGMPRSAAATAAIATGKPLPNPVACALAIVWDIGRLTGSSQKLCADDYVTLLNSAPEMIECLVECFARHKKGVGQAAVMAAVGRAYYSIGRQRTIEFAHAIHNPLDYADTPAAFFSWWLLESGVLSMDASTRRPLLYYTTEDVIHAFVQGQQWKRMRTRKEGPPRYSLPTEK